MSDQTQTLTSRIIIWVLLAAVLAGGGYLRLVGSDWDQDQHLHPDERFLTMVESSISPVDSVSEYFDTANSSLNPANRGHGFYVYGTLPLFLVRYAAEAMDQTGYSSVHLVGRQLSALVDLLTVFVVFLIGTQLFDRRVGLLGAAFSAFAVLQIQQSHFFTVDTFLTFFTVLAFYFAVEVAAADRGQLKLSSFLLFGLALGMAASSKINALPVALTLPAAAILYWQKLSEEQRTDAVPRLVVYVVAAAVISFLTFRIFQPYAFSGPGFLGIKPNQNWVSSLKALRAQTSGNVDFPPALQWARRPLWFSLKNMVVWGLGLPLGLLAWLGFGVMSWRVIKKRIWMPTLLLIGWTGLYFSWQSWQWNSTMRYQLPIYPLLAIFAGWLVIHVWDGAREGWRFERLGIRFREKIARFVIVGVTGLILLSTICWAFAFTRIYTRPHPRIAATQWIFQHVPGAVTLSIQSDQGITRQLLSFPAERVITEGQPWKVNFEPRSEGELTRVILPAITDQAPGQETQSLQFTLSEADDSGARTFERELSFSGSQEVDVRHTFQEPVPVESNKVYQLTISADKEGSAFSLQGAAIANESSWDDGLPLRMDGYDPFGGIYQGGLNFEMYWDDNQEKLERFLSTLEQTDYILITSSRQWASTTRVPERYPLTTKYYRELMGCPPEMTVERCYNRARPGMFQGNLGFEFIQVFQSNPSLGPVEINDQFAEEAFTVYDHPKVFIFRKSQAYNQDHVERILGSVDLSKVVHLTPKEAENSPGNLLLPPARLAEQRQGGTWDRLFDVEAAINQMQVLGVLVWYLGISAVGLVVYPMLRYVLSGLSDRGYPFARLAGLLLLSYGVWLVGSFRIPFSRLTIGAVLLFLAVAGAVFAAVQWQELKEEWQRRSRYFLIIEGIALGVFLLGLFVRYGNPDLWHPWKGGEKPMDFSYFNAVLKSTSFPPYDPWFAGGYINYYYYGFVLVGVPVKLLGIVPSFAYNLILPTILTTLALGGFSVAWNLFSRSKDQPGGHERDQFRAGLAGMTGLVLLGNLGTMRMIYRGFQRLAAGGADLNAAAWYNKVKWAAQGLVQFFKTPRMPFRLDEWYWNPSRVIAAEHGGAITEFPAFTYIYGDPHAHLIALPLTVLALAWAMSVIFERLEGEPRQVSLGRLFLVTGFGALTVGVLRPTNTWDFYPYLALGVVAILYGWWGDHQGFDISRLGYSVLQVLSYVGLAFMLFQPYARWYGQGYTSVQYWYGTNTPLTDYLTHWGLFLFLIVSWMAYETIHWMATTPVSALRKLEHKRDLFLALGLLNVVIVVSLGIPLQDGLTIGEFKVFGTGVHIIWLVWPLMIWTAILLLRPGFPTAKRIITFLVGTGLALTVMVEIVTLEGDIGRMNTVFKFYLQAWTLLALSAAASTAWLWKGLRKWPFNLRQIWQIGFALLLGAALLYPLLGGMARIRDRMTHRAPHTLDGMRFMAYATYTDLGKTMELNQDYQAIRWMQENIQGSPVIVEANQVEYHWGTRYTIYTGLPGVVGWSWHQRQQRNITPHDWVTDRVNEVNEFYNTTDLGKTREFLRQYDVSYIVLGQLEKAKYEQKGLEKFPAAEGVLWQPVFETGDTTIYQVLTIP